MGVVVSEMIMDTTMAVERVTANSRKRRPTIPPINRRGIKTAISEMLMVKTVKPISSAPFSAAAKGFMPSSRWRVMFSITTMASSTTNPVEMVRPSARGCRGCIRTDTSPRTCRSARPARRRRE
jgi:hypothetical protein